MSLIRLMRLMLVIGLTLLVDQISKYIVVTTMYQGQSIPVLSPVFHLTYILNPGAAFGLLANQTNFFIVVSLLVVLGVLVGYRFLPSEKTTLLIALGLVAGGALGNLVDRLRIGQVIDFLDFRVWPVFNLADTAIVLGATLLIIEVWREDKEEKRGYSSAKR